MRDVSVSKRAMAFSQQIGEFEAGFNSHSLESKGDLVVVEFGSEDVIVQLPKLSIRVMIPAEN